MPSYSSSTQRWALTRMIFFVSVAGVCIVILLFTFYKLLKRLCCSFLAPIFSRNRARQTQLLLDDHRNFDFDNPSEQNQSNALESTVIHSLPISQFKKENNKEELPPHNNSTECAVCLGEFEEGEWLRHLPNCTHAFHISCIDTWFRTHSNCPLCRSSVSYITTQQQQQQPEFCLSVSMFTIMDTLRREDFLQDRAGHYQMLRSEVLRNPELRYEPTGGL